MTKIVKLIANLSTDEQHAARDLQAISNTSLIGDFFGNLTRAISARQLAKSEEFILNAISCTTNILFYDTASADLLANQTRVQLFETLKQFMLAT